MKIAFGGGGTGGHIMPAIALADELSGRGHKCFFIGNSASIEYRLSTEKGYPFHQIKVQKLYRSFSSNNLLFPYLLIRSIFQARKILQKEAPDAVFCTGGFISGPVALAASWLRIPLFFHESNSFPGLVTRAMKTRITQIYVAFETSRKHLPGARIKNFGIPVKPQSTLPYDLSQIDLDSQIPTLLVTGGSQGSLAINNAVDAAVPAILERGFQLIWQTGNVTYQRFAPKYKGQKGLHLFAFSPDLARMLSKTDIAITRAGAMTIAELEENRVPAILIPLPSAAENHQFYNAREQQDKGVAYLLEQSHLNPGSLLESLDEVSRNLESYRQKLSNIPANSAAQQIVDDLLTNLRSSQGDKHAR